MGAADPQMQRQQMLAVVQKATTDLAAVMQGFDGKEKSKAPARLEDVVRGINGGSETISVEDITLMEQAVVETAKAAQVSSTEEPCPVEPSAALLSSLQTLGCASTMVPEDRLVAQRLLAAAIEMLLCGGSLVATHLFDQLSSFVGLTEVNATRRTRLEGDELEVWKKQLAVPLLELLAAMAQQDILEKRQTDDFIAYSVAPGGRPCLQTLRRFLEPTATRSGVEDVLRRAVNRRQRLRPAFSFALKPTESKAESADGGSTAPPESPSTPSSSRRSSNSRPGSASLSNVRSPAPSVASGLIAFGGSPSRPPSGPPRLDNALPQEVLRRSGSQASVTSSGIITSSSASCVGARQRSSSLATTGSRLIGGFPLSAPRVATPPPSFAAMPRSRSLVGRRP